MFGNLISGAVRLITIPVDVVEVGVDMVTGGDGSREDLNKVVPLPSNLRDATCDLLEALDD